MILEESRTVKSYIDDWFLPTDIWYIHTADRVRTKPHTTSNTDADTYTSLLQNRNFQVPNPI